MRIMPPRVLIGRLPLWFTELHRRDRSAAPCGIFFRPDVSTPASLLCDQ